MSVIAQVLSILDLVSLGFEHADQVDLVPYRILKSSNKFYQSGNNIIYFFRYGLQLLFYTLCHLPSMIVAFAFTFMTLCNRFTWINIFESSLTITYRAWLWCTHQLFVKVIFYFTHRDTHYLP